MKHETNEVTAEQGLRLAAAVRRMLERGVPAKALAAACGWDSGGPAVHLIAKGERVPGADVLLAWWERGGEVVREELRGLMPGLEAAEDPAAEMRPEASVRALEAAKVALAVLDRCRVVEVSEATAAGIGANAHGRRVANLSAKWGELAAEVERLVRVVDGVEWVVGQRRSAGVTQLWNASEGRGDGKAIKEVAGVGPARVAGRDLQLGS